MCCAESKKRFYIHWRGSHYTINNAFTSSLLSDRLFQIWFNRDMGEMEVDDSETDTDIIVKFLNGEELTDAQRSAAVEVGIRWRAPRLCAAESDNAHALVDCWQKLSTQNISCDPIEEKMAAGLDAYTDDDIRVLATLPIECLHRICRSASVKQIVKIVKAKDDAVAGILLDGLDGAELDENDINGLDQYTGSESLIRSWETMKKLQQEIAELKKCQADEVRRIRDLSQYIPFQGALFRGIFHHLCALAGGNIVEKGAVSIHQSIDSNQSLRHLIVESGNFKGWGTANEPNQWLAFEIKDCKLAVTAYAIRTHPVDENWSHMKSWNVEGSDTLESENWTVIDQRADDHHQNKRSAEILYTLNEMSRPWKFIRIIATGLSHRGDWNFFLSSIEFFGHINT